MQLSLEDPFSPSSPDAVRTIKELRQAAIALRVIEAQEDETAIDDAWHTNTLDNTLRRAGGSSTLGSFI